MKIPIKFNKIGAGAKAIDEANMPLTFKATAPSTVKLNATGSPTTSGLQYRLGTSGGWSPYVIGTEISLDTDKEVQFQNTEATLSLNNNNYVKFVMTGTIEASGNIQSMLNYSETVNSCCYQNLFKNCSSLITPPVLPVTDLTNATYCYASMFYGCTSLTEAPELSSITLANYCYQQMFSGCTSLTEAPELPATDLTNASYCYSHMFNGCTSLTEAPELPATNLAHSCYNYMFNGCTSLTEAPELPATNLTGYCYSYMFSGCTSLVEAPELPATTLDRNCYQMMFNGCTSLTEAPELPATTLADYCYNCMFENCSSLTKAPEILPATTLASECYNAMFGNCTSLTEAPELPATTLADYCYKNMFANCSSLIKAPEILPATTLASECYCNMFYGCTSLTEAPELPATDLTNASYCYWGMFEDCSSLTKAPELPATTLTNSCYNSMFRKCTSLTEAPELPATDLTNAPECYNGMFQECSNLSSVKVGFTEWNSNNTSSWLYGVSSVGTFTKLTALPEEFGNDYIPEGWTVVNSDASGEIIGWRVTAVDSSKITSSFDVQGMLDYAVGEYKFDQPLVEEENLGYSYTCAGTKTYWFAPGDTMAPEEYPHLPFSANYRFLYLEYNDGSWDITFVGPMDSVICQGSVSLDPSVKYNEIDLRTLELPLTLEPIYASTGETPADYKLQLTGSDYDGVYTMADTSATGYDRVWERTDEYGIRTCIRWYDEYSDWAICTANDNSTSNINNDSDWTPFDGFGSYENPYGNGTSGGGATLTITQ